MWCNFWLNAKFCKWKNSRDFGICVPGNVQTALLSDLLWGGWVGLGCSWAGFELCYCFIDLQIKHIKHHIVAVHCCSSGHCGASRETWAGRVPFSILSSCSVSSGLLLLLGAKLMVNGSVLSSVHPSPGLGNSVCLILRGGAVPRFLPFSLPPGVESRVQAACLPPPRHFQLIFVLYWRSVWGRQVS